MAQPAHEQFSSCTTKMFPTFEHSWTIDNISRFSNGTVVGYPRLFSPTFIAPPDKIATVEKKPVSFQLCFEPKGRQFKQDFVLISLVLLDIPSCSLNILYTFSVVKANGEKHIAKSEIHKYSEPITAIYVTHRMHRDELYNPANGFVSNDSITIHCEVVILLAETDKSDQYNQLVKSYGDLLESGVHSDVIFVLDDGQELRAHKNILAARSQVFADMCQFGTADNDRVDIVNTRVDVFKQALHFIYTGNVGASLDGIAQDLLLCADKYQLDPLKSMCEDHLFARITAESDLIELLELTDRSNASKLQAKVLALLAKSTDFNGQIMKLVQMNSSMKRQCLAAHSNTHKKSKRSN